MAKAKKTPQEEKLYNNILKSVRQYVGGRSFKKTTMTELMDKLGLPEQHSKLLRSVLGALVKEGSLELKAKVYTQVKNKDNYIEGTISVHPRGFGFVTPEKGSVVVQDVFIPKPFMLDAVHGDTVEVEINREVFSDKGPEGRVVAILQRGRTHLAGIIKNIDSKGYAWAYAPILGASKHARIEDWDPGALKIGDRVILSVLRWGEKDEPTLCQLTRVIGNISDPMCDIPAAIEEFEIRSVFSVHVQEEALKYGKSVKTKDKAGRLDLRQEEIFTIDPQTAKDFDDALSLRKDTNGHYHLGVHIADVSHYVKPGTLLDHEANLRCNSTYFPGVCIPMLPHQLSDNLCSLKEKVDRLTVSVIVELDADGTVLNYSIHRSVINSKKRFTYEEAKEVLDGKRKSKHAPTLHLMAELCRLLKKKRFERGSIEFSVSELVVSVNEKGEPTGTRRVEYDITHQLVEEFMLKANELVAQHLAKEGKQVAYRVHDQPAQENIRDFALITRAFGYNLPKDPSTSDLQKLFDEAQNTPWIEYLANAYIRRLRLACYSEENIGHYGLSLDHYCHFTSPIRRYVDLIIHRSLFSDGYTGEEIAAIAANCSDQERKSARAEQSVLLLKKLRWLVANNTSRRQFEAIITKVKPFGFYFEVLEIMLEGFLHVSELHRDYYVYNDHDMKLVGSHTNETFQMGSKVLVMLKKADLITSETAWHFAGSLESDLPSQKPASPKKSAMGQAKKLFAKPSKKRETLGLKSAKKVTRPTVKEKKRNGLKKKTAAVKHVKAAKPGKKKKK